MLFENSFWRFVRFLGKSVRKVSLARRKHRWNEIELLEDRLLLTPTVSLIKEIGPWDDSIGMMATDSGLFFSVSEFGEDATSALWITNGTASGTIKLREFHEIASSGRGESFIEYHGEVYFSVTGFAGDPDIGLWKSDGTVGGTVQVLEMDGPPNDFVILNDKLYFNGVDDAHSWELWTSDGTAAGTHMVIDLLPGDDPGLDSFGGPAMVVFNNELYFAGQSTPENLELWASDGTAEGTRLVKNLYTGSYIRPFDGARVSSSSPQDFTVINNRLVFVASIRDIVDEPYAYTLWSSDGTTDGTIQIKNLNGTIAGTTATVMTGPDFLGTYQDLLYFSPETDDPHSDQELWVTDGTLGGTRFIKDLRSGPSSIAELAGSNGLVYFNAGDDTHGEFEPWVTDGTTAGTHLLLDLAPGTDRDGDPNSSRPGLFYPFGDHHTVFRANAENKGAELWLTDGSAAGTIRVTDLFPGKHSSFPYPFTNLSDGLLFFANDIDSNYLYRLTLDDASGGPQISPQSFNLAENSAVETVVGTVAASAGRKQKLTYTITGGDPDGIFAIDPQTGQLTVQNPAGVDFESSSTFTLTVRVSVAKTPSQAATAAITIQLTDQAESTMLTVNALPLSLPARSASQLVDSTAEIGVVGSPPSSWAGAVLSVNIAKNRQAKDQLSILSSTTGDQPITVKGKALLRGSTAIATIAGGKGKQATLRITFLAAATFADVVATLRQVAFATKGTAGQRDVVMQLLGVNGQNSAAARRTVQVT